MMNPTKCNHAPVGLLRCGGFAMMHRSSPLHRSTSLSLGPARSPLRASLIPRIHAITIEQFAVGSCPS